MATETIELATPETATVALPLAVPELRPKRLRSVELLLVMSVAFAPLIFSSTFAYLQQSPNRFNNYGVASLILHESIALGVLAYVLSRQRRRLRDIGLRFRISDAGMGILLAIAGMLAATLWQSPFYAWQVASRVDLEKATENAPSLAGLGLIAIVLVLLNPLFEELLVRGYFITELSLLTRSRWAPIAASALLQGGYHLYQGVPRAVGVTACFLVWSIYFSHTRRLGPVIFAHFYLDACALLRST